MSPFLIIQAGIFLQPLFTGTFFQPSDKICDSLYHWNSNHTKNSPSSRDTVMRTCLRVIHKRCYVIKIVYFPPIVFILPSTPLYTTYSLIFLFILLCSNALIKFTFFCLLITTS